MADNLPRWRNGVAMREDDVTDLWVRHSRLLEQNRKIEMELAAANEKVRMLRTALIKTARLLDQYGALEDAKAADKALVATSTEPKDEQT